ncbi:hypothetical protein [Salininema proteolyticum]|uniref:Uncharacterized protein n=1 Tax=Salininema proteolyticum TaxID=1607685 RepID=A0ABV8TY14_9ACTN
MLRISRLLRQCGALGLEAVLLVPTALRRRTNGDASPVRRSIIALGRLLLGTVSIVLAGFLLLTFARGALYGFFDSGPYDDSWGGPTLAGAWLTHFLLSLVFQAAILLALAGIGGLGRNISAPLRLGETSWWAWPLTVLIGTLTVLLVIGWARQI